MIGFLVKAGVAGVAGYAIGKVLEKNQVAERVTAKVTEVLDHMLTGFITDNISLGKQDQESAPESAPTSRDAGPAWLPRSSFDFRDPRTWGKSS